MKVFNKIFTAVILILTVLFVSANIILAADNSGGRPYRVEINCLAHRIEKDGYADVSDCEYVTNIQRYGENFYVTESDYNVREINGELYRFDYKTDSGINRTQITVTVNVILGVMAAVIISIMLYVKFKILAPFERLSDVPYELSKGNLIAPVKATKNRFFGRFIWGVDMLRENIEQQKVRELELQKEKKMLLLSLSHDIKTPLSAIKLYSKALSKGLYESREKQIKIAESINDKADEIESYVSQIVTASKENFLSFDENMGEFYLSGLVTKIRVYYAEKLFLIGTDFSVSDYSDCLLIGDIDRSVEVVQNVMENAVKYGDGNCISISFSEEEGGGMLCLIGMLILRKIIDEKHIWICSVMGAVLHNIGQIIVAVAVMKTTAVVSYLPLLLVSGCIAGAFTGICAQILITKVRMREDKND